MGRKSREKALRRGGLPAGDILASASPDDAPLVPGGEPDATPPPAPAEPPTRLARLRPLLAESWPYLALSFVFLVLKAYTATPSSGDEHIYTYVGLRVAQGVTPYVDILFAHPPVHLLIAVLWMAFVDYTPLWGKLASIVPALLCLWVVIWTLRRVGVSRPAAFLAALLLATSYDYLSVSSHFTGANWSYLFLTAGLGLLVIQRPLLAGLLLALALLTSAHVAPALIGIALAAFILDYRRGWRVGAMTLGVTVAVHLFCLIAFGDPYYEQVFGYHAAKTPMQGGGMTAIIRFFHNEYHLTVLGLLALLTWSGLFLSQMGGRPLSLALRIGLGLLALAQVMEAAANGLDGPRLAGILLAGGAAILWTLWERRRGGAFPLRSLKTWPFAFITGAAALAQSAGVLSVDRVFTYYLAPLLPLFTLLAGWFFQQVVEILRGIREDMTRSEPVGGRFLALTVLALIGVAGLVAGEGLEKQMGYYQREYGKRFQYDWQDSPALPGFLNTLVRVTLFKSERRIGDLELGITRYLWHEMRTEDPSVLLPHFAPYAAIPGTLFGDASTTGFYALMTGRRIALEMADTNAQLFKSGLIDMDRLIARFAADPPLFLVMNPARGVGGHPALKRHAAEHYRLLAREVTVDKQTLLLYVRREVNP